MPIAKDLDAVYFAANVSTVAVNVTFGNLPEASQRFIIEYGLKQYIQDGAAVSKEFTSGERKGEKKTAEEIAAEKTEGVEERLDNLRSGEFIRRGTVERLSPEEMRRVAYIEDTIRTAAAKARVKLPTKKADATWWTDKVASYYEKNQAAVDKEMARQARELDKIEIDLSDLPAK